jgi:hypothetical protein
MAEDMKEGLKPFEDPTTETFVDKVLKEQQIYMPEEVKFFKEE